MSAVKEIDIYNGVTTDFFDSSTRNLLDRWQPMHDWLEARSAAGIDPYSKVITERIAPETRALDRAGRVIAGVNFASQEYLSLASDERIVSEAEKAADQYGVHSAGSAALMGLCVLTAQLEERVAKFVGLKDATVFPTGWGAGYGAIRTLVKPGDHVIIDFLAHACLQEAASVSGAKVHRFPHCSTEGVERRLARILKDNPDAGILVITEGVFSMDSDIPDIVSLQDLCRAYGATLFLDVAHDLGAIGATGRGVPELQGMVGKVDIVMGSFSKTFASNGGFVATNHPALKLAMRYGCGPLTFSNALSPIQASVVLACFDIVDSPEGQDRREKLMRNSLRMRSGMEANGFKILGQPSAIVPVILGNNAISREMTSAMLTSGALVNLVEYPAVAKNACRWRIQIMADHTEEQIDTFIDLAVRVRDYARQRFD
jgi:glycine C-acetyltransferase